MIEIVLTSGAVGFVAAAAGSIIATAVQRNENSHFNRRLDEHGVILAQHAKAIQNIITRKHCAPCMEQDELRTKLSDERHEETLRRLDVVDTTVKQCFEDFIRELKSGK